MSKVWRQVGAGVICGMTWFLSGCYVRERVVIIEADNPYTRMMEEASKEPVAPPKPKINCENAVLNVRGSIYDEKGNLIRQLGPVATGRWYQGEFAAVYFFSSLDEAWYCDPKEEVAVWDELGKKWKKP